MVIKPIQKVTIGLSKWPIKISCMIQPRFLGTSKIKLLVLEIMLWFLAMEMKEVPVLNTMAFIP
jgi:hypothetical protein